MPFNDVNNDVLSLLLILLIVVTVNNSRNKHRLTSSALVHPSLSPWIQLLRNADDSSFLTVTGFSRFAFVELERALYPLEDIVASGKKRGRPETLDNKGKLGLYLLFFYYLPLFSSSREDCFYYVKKQVVLIVGSPNPLSFCSNSGHLCIILNMM